MQENHYANIFLQERPSFAVIRMYCWVKALKDKSRQDKIHSMQRVPTKSQIRGADRQLEQGWCQQRLELKFIGRTAPVISMYAFPLNKYTSLKKKSIWDKANAEDLFYKHPCFNTFPLLRTGNVYGGDFTGWTLTHNMSVIPPSANTGCPGDGSTSVSQYTWVLLVKAH